jgi:hypothetical protein
MTKRKKYSTVRTVRIYEIVCRETKERFIGSHLDLLPPKYETLPFKDQSTCCSFELIKRGNYEVRTLETFLAKYELSRLLKEQYYIDNTVNINKYRAYTFFQKKPMTHSQYEFIRKIKYN